MSGREREKGLGGEREVAAIYTTVGLEVRGLEGGGDHLVTCGHAGRLVIHSESKRHETARPWAWWEQASREAPAGAVPVVAFRRNRSRWLAQLDLEDLAALAALAGYALDNLPAANRSRLAEWRTLAPASRVAADTDGRQNHAPPTQSKGAV